MPLFSNPTPGDQTFGAIAATGRAQAEPIAGVVAAILADRARKQQAFQQTLDQVSKVAGDDRDYQLRKQLIEAQVGQIGANTNAINNTPADYVPGVTPETSTDASGIHYVRGRYGWQAVSQSATGGLTALQKMKEQRLEEQQAQKDLQQQIVGLNVAGGLPEKGANRITEATLGSQSDVHSGTGPGGEYIPEGYYGIGGKQLETVIPSGQFDQVHNAANAYRAMTDSNNAGGVPQEQPQAQGQYPVGTRAKQGGVTYEFDGSNWHPVQ